MALPVNFNVSALIESSGGKGGRAQHGRPGYPPHWRGRTATASGLASSFQTSCCALCSILGHYYCAPTVCARVRAASRWMLRRTGAQVRGLCAYAASGQAGQRR